MKIIIFVSMLLIASNVLADESTCNTEVKINSKDNSASTTIYGDAAKAIYESMIKVPESDGGGMDSLVTIKKGQYVECTKDDHISGVSYYCVLTINSDGTVAVKNFILKI